MTRPDSAVRARRHETSASPDDGLGEAVEVPSDSRRARLRSKPGIGQAYRVGVFLAGLLCIALGFALAVLPGPLTIPPVLLGLWIWSTEFAFAERFFDRFKDKAQDAWDHAKAHPKSSAAITIGGLVLAAAAFWAAGHFDLVARAKDAVGL
jgi:uncharacterized membrane protein YbaN (DUF454 family)